MKFDHLLNVVMFMAIGSLSCASHDNKRVESSPNYRNGAFHNTQKLAGKSFWKFIKMRMNSEWSDWPEWREIEEGPKPDKKVKGPEIKLTFINHATVLIQSQGLNILTDPHFSKRCSPVQFLGPARVHKPGVAFDKLPPIDVVIISHDHYDHLDLGTIEKLVTRDNPKIFVGLGVGKRLSSQVNVFELDWWESFEVSERLRVNFVEVQHFSGRSLSDRNSTLWGGFVLEMGQRKIYFGGDSGYADHYKRTFNKFGNFDVALLPIGAYSPQEFMGPMHMNPGEAIQAHKDLHAKKSVGIHYGTFQLTAEPIDEPVKLLRAESSKAGLTDNEFMVLDLGKAYSF